MEERDSALKIESSAANGADDRGAYPKHWYVARVQMNCEKKSAQRISSLGYEIFVPVQQEVRQWSDRRKKIERILIPLLVFFKSDVAGAKQIQRLSFVYDLLKAPGDKKPAVIPDDQIDRFKFMIGNCDDEITIKRETINIGDKVRVVRGSLKGLEGYATSTPDGKTEISIFIEKLFCASVKINPADLEIVQVANSNQTG